METFRGAGCGGVDTAGRRGRLARREGGPFAAVEPVADAASQQRNQALLGGVAEVLLGRPTYDLFVQYWVTGEDPIAQGVNAIPTTVFSRTLTRAP